MKILLMNLPRESQTKDYTTPAYLLEDFVTYPPLGLLAIAADVNPKHSIKVLDVIAKNMSIEDTVRYIENYKPEVLGLSVVTRRLYSLYEISRRIKEALPDTKIVAGGPHINYWPEETMQLGTLDYVLPGDGEKTFPLLIDGIEKGEGEELPGNIPNLYYRSSDGQIHSNPPEEMPIILDSLPFPNRRLVDLDDYYTAVDKARMTTMYSSRGCPFHCIFCDVQENSFRYRTAKSVVDEFEEIIKLGIKEIHIFDDTFNIRRQRVIDICHEILERGLKVRWSGRARVFPFDSEMMRLLKEAGCTRLHVGVESLDPTILRYMNKKQTLEQIRNFFALCHEFGIETLAYLIIGFPVETGEYRAHILDEIIKLDPTYVYFNILYPLPKTQYYQSLLEDGTYKQDYWADFVRNPKKDYELPLPRSPELQKELEALADDSQRKFCYRPVFILRELKGALFHPKLLLFKAKFAFLLLLKTWHRR